MTDKKETEAKHSYTGALVMSTIGTKRYALLGREAIVPNWSESGRWSDFGGLPESTDKSVEESIARECYEETMGILGCMKTLITKIKASTIYTLGSVRIVVLETDYQDKLPEHYNLIYQYLAKCTVDHPTWKPFKYIPTCPKGYCEKIELRWFDLDDIIAATGDKDQAVFRKSFLRSIEQMKDNLVKKH